MRRIVRDDIATAIDRARPDFERYIAGHLQYPASVPLVFTDGVASIREIRNLKVTPRFPGDYPAVDVIAALSVSLTARSGGAAVASGAKTFVLDVELRALGTVVGAGYDVVPQPARLRAWL